MASNNHQLPTVNLINKPTAAYLKDSVDLDNEITFDKIIYKLLDNLGEAQPNYPADLAYSGYDAHKATLAGTLRPHGKI